MTRRCVWSRNLEHEEVKARYRAVKNANTVGCNDIKTNKLTILYTLRKVTTNIIIIVIIIIIIIIISSIIISISIIIYNMFHYVVILHALFTFKELLSTFHYLYLVDLYRYHLERCLLWEVCAFIADWQVHMRYIEHTR